MEWNRMEVHQKFVEPWKVTLVDTGMNSMTGGRVKRIAPYIGENTFMVTYGDGVADINISALVSYHKTHGRVATITSTQPSGRFGALICDAADNVNSFQEKPAGDGSWINGGFFVFEPEIFDRIPGNDTVLERETLEGLARDGQLVAYRHSGFWQPMDTLRDKLHLEELWAKGKAPWKMWE
jgi:glucose-1-phosphate cytidylyltransferase